MARSGIFTHGYVVGILVLSRGDSDDEGRLPDAVAATNRPTFTRLKEHGKVPLFTPEAGAAGVFVSFERVTTAVIQSGPHVGQLTSDVDKAGAAKTNATPGVELVVGAYRVDLGHGYTPQKFDIEVTAEHTQTAPLDLYSAAPYVPPSSMTVQTVLLPPGAGQGDILTWSSSGATWHTPQAATDTTIAGLLTDPATSTRAAMDSRYVDRRGIRGQTRTIYVRADGNDSTGDGRSPETAYREIRTAVDSLTADGPVVRGTVVIDVGPGIYKGGIRPPVTRNAAQDDFVKILGPNVDGHPNVPTAIIAKQADTSATYGIQALNGWWLWVENVKITGAFNTGLDARAGTTLHRHNVHIDGPSIGVNVTGGVSDNTFGGIVENCTSYGVQEMYNVTRTYGGGAGQGTIYRNNPYGIYSKSNCFGHLDDAVFENCPVAIHLDGGRANLLRVAISGASVVGISLKDSEIHNDTGITWGAGNGRRVLSYGPASNEADTWGWGNNPQATLRDGQRPLLMMRHSYTPTTVTGTTTSTTVATFAGMLPAGRFAVEAKKMRVQVIGDVDATLAAALYVWVQVGGTNMLAIPLPAATTAGAFTAEVEMTCLADGGDLLFVGHYVTTAGGSRAFSAVRTKDISSANATVAIRVQPFDAADSVTIRTVEIYG